jgi:hypothetical protein
MAHKGAPAIDRLLSRVQYDTNGGCWLFDGNHYTRGYAQIWVDGRNVPGHRVAFEHFHGRKPTMMVCHKCDVRCCVNPDHLFEGSHLDNVNDMVAKGRQGHGSANGRARLTEKDVADIIASPQRGAVLARQYGVGSTAIYNIRNGLAWRRVERTAVR